MPAARRPQLDDRRRLVIYSQRFAEDSPAQSKRALAADAALRSARKPAAAYGWRVQRRLRARWFSMVPVRRRTLCGVMGAIAATVLILALGHWAALWWAPLALRPGLARPLRLDRPDSLGTWFSVAMLATTAAMSLLVYQLRRYRTDDYRGHYRLWPIAIVISLLASLDAVTDLVGWCGAAVDVVLAERDVIAGADWIRLLLAVGGAAFGLRLIAELSRCRTAAACALLALTLVGVSPAVRWNLLRFDPATSLTWVPILLMAGRAVLLAAVVIYLRMLYREVRNLNSGTRLRDRMRGLLHRPRGEAEACEPTPARRRRTRSDVVAKPDRAETAPAEDAGGSEEAADVATELHEGRSGDPPRRRLRLRFWRHRSQQAAADGEAEAEPAAREAVEENAAPPQENMRHERKKFALPFVRRRIAQAKDHAEDDARHPQADPPQEEVQRERRKFRLPFSRRRDSASDADAQPSRTETELPQQEVQRERRKFGLPFGRRRASASDGDAQPSGTETELPQEEVQRERRKFGLPFGRRRDSASDGEEEAGDAKTDPPRPSAAPRPSLPAAESDDESDMDPEGIDWDSLNKSERRRARKLLKRQGKAA